MDTRGQEDIALHRWAVIAEAAGDRLTPGERGALVRQIAARAHAHPDGPARTYSRGTIDRWLRAWRRGGLEALKPSPRAGTGVVRAHPELFAGAAALRLELPGRPAAQIASILYHRHGITVSERTVRGQLRRAGLHREALAAGPKAYGRYEAARPNERWITDVLAGPWVPYPKRDGSARARLFLIVDDHSRLLVDGRFYDRENARICQELLRRAITRRGVPEILYADNGAPFANAWLARTCAVLGIRLIHSKPYSPQGRGKQERANRYIREAFLAEAVHHGIESLDQLNDWFAAWAEQVANRRVHAETGQAPIDRFQAAGPHRQADPALIREAFRWSVTRRVTRVATVPLEGNSYSVDPALVGRRVELRYDPENLAVIEVFLDGRPAGAAVPFVIGRHVHRAVAPPPPPAADPTGIDYLGMVAAARDEQAGTSAAIDFTQLKMLPRRRRPRGRRWLAGRRGPRISGWPTPRSARRSRPGTCSPARPTPRPPPGSASASTRSCPA
jgi:putative transposase